MNTSFKAGIYSKYRKEAPTIYQISTQ